MEVAEREAFLERLAKNWRTAGLDSVDYALCTYAEKLTRAPSTMNQADIERLQHVELDQESIHDAIQVVSYFNYINRIADAVHVDLEPEMKPYPEDLPPGFGG
ncbi:MAG: putative peroxidase-related enzyme [Planctomycetota bacterium]|jgi:uncharacterized peroxidase-related enzyme